MMPTITRLDSRDPEFQATLSDLLAVDAEQDDAIDAAAASILQQVRREGDSALLRFTRQFDHVDVASVAALEIPRREWE